MNKKSTFRSVTNNYLIHPNNNKGITLVALVITIIILIILATISINILLGENGLIAKAQHGSENYQQAAEKEAQLLEDVNAFIEEYTDDNIIYGDINLDGTVNAADKIYLSRYLENLEGYTLNNKQRKRADVNIDGKVDSEDLEIMQKHLAGWSGYEALPIV